MADPTAPTETERLQATRHARPDDVPLSQLFRDLAEDGRRLMRDEVGLAKLELTRPVRSVARDAGLAASGLFVAAMGAACLVAALVIGLGILMGSYALSALLVGAVLVLLGGIAAVLGLHALRSVELTPDQTIQSLKNDAAWVGDELRGLRRDARES